MIAKVSKGKKMAGLVAYLAGPGRANEHTDMHVVVASDVVVSVRAGEALGKENTAALGRELDQPRKTFQQGSDRRSVFHVSLSLGADEGVRDDAFWAAVVRDFVGPMGLDGDDAKAPCRWVAIRHGVSKNGNDHVHIAASMVREDGTRWSEHNDHVRAQRAVRAIEKQYGLRILGEGVKTRGYAEGEAASLARRRAAGKYAAEVKQTPGMVPWGQLDQATKERLIGDQVVAEQPRVDLMLHVRGAGAGARSEAEYVRRLRGAGLLVRPYYAKGGTDQVTGYSVAFRPQHGERPIWYGGGTLAKDLTLPALREGWKGDDPAAAVGEWHAAGANRRPVSPDPVELTSATAHAYFDDLNQYLTTLADTSVQDPAAYAQIAREGAGLFASWSVAAGKDGDAAQAALRDAAKVLAKHAQLSDQPRRAVAEPSKAFVDVASHLAISASSRAGAVAVVRAWAALGEQLGQALVARGIGQAADRLAVELRSSLDEVHAAYRQPERPTARDAASPVPATSRTAVVDRAATLDRLEERLRAAGLSDAAVEARMHAERQQRFPAGERPAHSPEPDAPTVRPDTTNPSRQQHRGPEKGRSQ